MKKFSSILPKKSKFVHGYPLGNAGPGVSKEDRFELENLVNELKTEFRR